MKVCFETSVLVAALVQQRPYHAFQVIGAHAADRGTL